MKYFLVLILMGSCLTAIAETFSHSDTIDRLGAIMTREESDFVIVKGFTSAGSCPLSNGLVAVRFSYGESGKRAYSIALAAKISGKKIRLTVDDTNKHPVDGGCFATSIVINE